jgi:xanthine/CO dehydrogenase XdhC/CoxF family maturation factor
MPFMNPSGNLLGDFFEHYRLRGEPLVLATIVGTQGSTYRKAGAQMLIAADGSVAGLLSGGCLEADLAAHSQYVIEHGRAQLVRYDMRTSDDLMWGLGLGCEGSMQILLTRLSSDNRYQPFAFAQELRETQRAGSYAIVIESTNPRFPTGAALIDTVELPGAVSQGLMNHRVIASDRRMQRTAGLASTVQAADATFLIVAVEAPLQLLILGAGPDAMPLSEIAGLMEWHHTILDHRPAYAVAARFPRARLVHCQPAENLPALLTQRRFDAAVVMSHHLLSDASYLAALADADVPYVGLLGPAPRRARLLQDIGDCAARLAPRLYGPIGLDIGANTPQTIALAIVGEIQAVLSGRPGGSFSESGSSGID